jgi:hypothetical protein
MDQKAGKFEGGPASWRADINVVGSILRKLNGFGLNTAPVRDHASGDEFGDDLGPVSPNLDFLWLAFQFEEDAAG